MTSNKCIIGIGLLVAILMVGASPVLAQYQMTNQPTIQVMATIGATNYIGFAQLKNTNDYSGAYMAPFSIVGKSSAYDYPVHGEADSSLAYEIITYTVTNIPGPGAVDRVYMVITDSMGETAQVDTTYFNVEFVGDPANTNPICGDDGFVLDEDASYDLGAAELFTNDWANQVWLYTYQTNAADATDPAGQLTFTGVSAVSGPTGHMTVTNQGGTNLMVTLDDSIPDVWGTYTFDYTVQNSVGAEGTATVTIEVPSNKTARAVDQVLGMNEMDCITVMFTNMYHFPDNAPVTYGVTVDDFSMVDTNDGSLTVTNDSFTYCGTNNWLTCEDTGVLTINFEVYTDDNGTQIATNSGLVTITVTNALIAPTATTNHYEYPGCIASNSAGITLYVADLLDPMYVDYECVDRIVLDSVQDPSALGGTVHLDDGYLQTTGTVTYIPPGDVAGVTDSFTYVAMDLGGGAATQTAYISICTGAAPVDTCTQGYITNVDVCSDGESVTLWSSDLIAPVMCPCTTAEMTIAGADITPMTLERGQYQIWTNTSGNVVAFYYVSVPAMYLTAGPGTDIFEYIVTDCEGNKSTNYIYVTVRPAISPSILAASDETMPTIVQDSGNSSLSEASILVNCTPNPNMGGYLDVVSLDTPMNGTASLIAGDVVYTPDDGFRGTDSFDYYITDGSLDACGGNLNMATGTLTVTVTADLDAPIAEDDEYVVALDEVLGVAMEEGLLANDWSYLIDLTAFPPVYAWDALTVENVTAPIYGSVSVDATGAFTYEPGTTPGMDTFSYQAYDGNLYSEVAYVDIYVTPAEYVQHDYDGDGAADVGVIGPQGDWYIMGAFMGMQWGWSDVIPVPGDYDGDNIGDIAVYHPAMGDWYVFGSEGEELMLHNWGWSEAVPVPADYDGDGVTDFAVYDEATGMWYVDVDGFGPLQWGWDAALPIPADYDGDGVTDLSVYDPMAGNWYIRYSDLDPSDPQPPVPVNWGWDECIPAPADFDGDGDVDVCAFDFANLEWYIWPDPTPQAIVLPLGAMIYNPIPVPADYDGDGAADLAIYDFAFDGEGTGIWYFDSMTEIQWGYDGAWPVSSAAGLLMADWAAMLMD